MRHKLHLFVTFLQIKGILMISEVVFWSTFEDNVTNNVLISGCNSYVTSNNAHPCWCGVIINIQTSDSEIRSERIQSAATGYFSWIIQTCQKQQAVRLLLVVSSHSWDLFFIYTPSINSMFLTRSMIEEPRRLHFANDHIRMTFKTVCCHDTYFSSCMRRLQDANTAAFQIPSYP
jgi:hypothetical protein